MTESNGDEGVKLPTPLGTIAIRGSAVFIVLAFAIVMYLTFTEHNLRSYEHDQIIAAVNHGHDEITNSLRLSNEIVARVVENNNCLIRLALYQTLRPRGEPIDFYNLPSDLLACAPGFLFNKGGKP